MPLTVDIDGTDITPLCQRITWRPKLNRKATGIVRFPGHLFQATTGISEMHIYDTGSLVFSGPVWYQQVDGSPDSTYTEVTAYDHLVYLTKRLCKTSTGNLIDPSDVILNEVEGPAIMAAFIQNAIDDANAATPPSDPLPLAVGSVATGGADLSGVPTNFPMTLDQMRALLVSTGQLNLLLTPGIGGSVVNLTNGGVVNDLSGSVTLSYQTGSYNAQVATDTEDMEDVINALWYLLGPRGPQPGIPIDHWGGSITPSAPNAGGDGEGGLPGDSWPPELVARFVGSRLTYGYMQEIRVFDDKGDEQQIRELFEEEWANEAWIRATPRQMASIRPERGSALNFSVGDKITVEAGSRLGGGFSGAQVVYEMEVTCDADGVVEITDIITSADQEGA